MTNAPKEIVQNDKNLVKELTIEDEKLRAIQKMTLKKDAKKPKKYKTESERIQDEFKKGLYG